MKAANTVAVCPGSFDPVTLGHLDVVQRAVALFGDVIVGVGRNSTKNYLFSFSERMHLTRDAVASIPGARVMPVDGLLVDFCRKQHASVIVKGLRFASDFDFELQMAHMNQAMTGIETVLLLGSRMYGSVTSTILREVALNGGDISAFVTAQVDAAVREKVAAMKTGVEPGRVGQL